MNSVLKILADDKIFLKEKRSKKRFFFTYTAPAIEILGETETVFGKAKLVNVTSDGFGFYVKSENKKLFNETKPIGLKSIGGIDFPTPLKGVIKHVSKVQKQTDHQYGSILVGVKFDQTSKIIMKVIDVLKTLN